MKALGQKLFLCLCLTLCISSLRQLLATNQVCCRSNQLSIVPCFFAVRKQGNVFQTRTDSMAPVKCALIHLPARYAVTVVNLFERDVSVQDNVFHRCGMLESSFRILFEGLKNYAPASGRQTGTDESTCILEA